MRRAAPSPALRVDAAAPPVWGRVASGQRGLGFVAAAPPDGLEVLSDPPPWRPRSGAPFATNELVVVADGGLVLAAAPGVARSLRAPGLEQAFDRRPPGLSRVVGATKANAGLLRDDGGWRAVVLPSLGDLAAGLGDAPVALRPDGRAVATVRDERVVEISLAGGEESQVAAGAPAALVYRSDGGLRVASGDAVGAPGVEATGDGSPVVALTAAAVAPRVLARHADGTLSLWESGAADAVARWASPVAGPVTIALSADGCLAAVATPFADPASAAIIEADSGRVVMGVEGARAAAFSPDGSLVLGGDFGVMWCSIPEETK